MTSTTWGLVALGGIGIVVVANALRAARTHNPNCLGHFFVSADQMTRTEHITNRAGIATFTVGVVAALLV